MTKGKIFRYVVIALVSFLGTIFILDLVAAAIVH